MLILKLMCAARANRCFDMLGGLTMVHVIDARQSERR